MMKVGVTGGIGSGKTMVCKLFGMLGVPVYNSDTSAKIISNTNHEVIKELKQLCGNDIYKDGALDREKLSGYIFKQKELLQKVNAIIHPRVKQHFNLWLEKHNLQSYIIQESALIIEAGLKDNLDKVLVVTAPKELRIIRIIQRSGLDRNQIQGIIDNQTSDEEKIAAADAVICNDDKTMLIKQVLHLHTNFINLN